MDQLGSFAGAAGEIAHLAHEQAAALGPLPVPTMIVLGLAALFALIGLVTGGVGRRRRGGHRA
jgi:hypothetical protein